MRLGNKPLNFAVSVER